MGESGRGREGPAIAARGATLFGLWGVAISQPLFDQLKDGQVVVLAGWRGLDLVIFALVVSAVVPLGLMLLEGLVSRIRPGWSEPTHLVLVATLAAMAVSHTLKAQAGADGVALVAGGLLGGGAIALAVHRWNLVRSYLAVLGVFGLAFPLMFLLFSPITPLVTSSVPPRNVKSSPRMPPIVVVVLDEFPAASLLDDRSRLDRPALPGFARLSDSSTWYRNATAVTDFTHLAVPAILDGRFPKVATPPASATHPDNLFTVLPRAYRLHADEQVTALCPPDWCDGQRRRSFPQRLLAPMPAMAKLAIKNVAPTSVTVRVPERPAFDEEPAVPSFREFLKGIRSEDAPSLRFHHALLPHLPWTRLPSGRLHAQPCCETDLIPGRGLDLRIGLPTFGLDRWTQSRAIMRNQQQLHLAQVRYTDSLIGQLLDRLETAGELQRSLVIVTADHGVSVTPGVNARRLTPAGEPEILPVPLFVKRPGQRQGRVDDRPVRNTAITSTILDYLGLRPPKGMTEPSLFAPGPRPDRLRYLNALSEEHRTISARRLERRTETYIARRREQHEPSAGELYATGRYEKLVGRSVHSIRTTPARPAPIVQITELKELRWPPADSTFSPANITGTLAAPTVGESLAVAVNGRIAGVAEIYRSGVVGRFSVLTDERRLRPQNRVRAYLVRGNAAGPVLTPVPLRPGAP